MSREIEEINCPDCWSMLLYTGITDCSGWSYYKCIECKAKVKV